MRELLRSVFWGLGMGLAVMPLQAAPPVAAVENVPTVHHGVTVPDPYRWLEDTKSERAQTWMRGQGEAARQVLDRIDQRDTIEARLTALSRASGDVVRSVVRMPGDRLYYLHRKAGGNQFRLMFRQGLNGPERVLVDPEQESQRSGTPHAINHFTPSWDGRYLAYGMSAGGSENATLQVLDLTSGKTVVPPLPRVLSEVNWLPDSRSLLANQLKAPQPGEVATEHYLDSQVLWLRVDTPEAAPQPVFSRALLPALGLERLDFAELITAAGSRWVVARTTDTTVPEGKLFAAPLAQLGRPDIAWRTIGTPADLVQDVALQGDRLLVLTRAGAPRRKLVAVDLRDGTLTKAQLVVPEPSSGMLQWFVPTRGGAVVGKREGTAVLPWRYAAGQLSGRRIVLPAAGAVWPTSAPAADDDEVLVSFSGWTEPTRYLRLQGLRAKTAPLMQPVAVAGAPRVVVQDVEFSSHDGVKVPMTLLHREGLKLDGSNPVLLSGYATYGFSITAGYSPGRIAWLERGGVLAFVNARGSGVHGDAWHRAGFKQTKRNTWLDGVAAARWLFAQGYASPKTLAIMGTSGGGIFVGRASTTAPELFAAAVYDVGVLDTVRFETTANGITNISELGTVKDPGEFAGLLEMSTYHAIKDGTRYPGVLLVHGINDPRVDVSQSAKTAARLQAATTGGPVLMRLDAKAGHGVGSTASQRDALQADIYAFLLWQMGKLPLKD